MEGLAPFRVVLLDMNGTFMFGGDRFGLDEDYAATYRTIGGKKFSDRRVTEAVVACYEAMAARYEDPAYYDDFPQVIDILRQLPQTEGWAESEIDCVEQVIAQHELGTVPPAYATFLKRLARTHTLGLVANIWSKKGPWLHELQRVGVHYLFSTQVFSSDSASIKPSPVLFEETMKALDIDRSRVVFIGDDLKHDIRGAQAVGLSTIWIQGSQPSSDLPDRVITDLLDLDA